jgi:hypothetical protein
VDVIVVSKAQLEPPSKMYALPAEEAPVTAHESVIATVAPKPPSAVYCVKDTVAVVSHVPEESV